MFESMQMDMYNPKKSAIYLSLTNFFEFVMIAIIW